MPRKYRKGKDSLSYDLRVRISAETAEALEAAAAATFQTRAQLARIILDNHLQKFQQKRSAQMKHRIFKLSQNAIENCLDWDTAIEQGELVTIKEFDTYEEAVNEFENGETTYDPDLYGVE